MIVLITALVFVIIVAVPSVFAASSEDSNFFDSMFDFHKKWIERSVQNGDITEEEADQWNEHFNEMEEYHEENGFSEHCGGFGDETENESYRSEFGSGMMGSGGMMGSVY